MRLYANLTRLLSKAFRTGPQVAVVGTQIVKFDGTSNAIRDTIRAVTDAGWRVSIFTRINQFEDIPAQLVTSAHDISQRAAFQSADVIIYHFAFYDELFEIMQNGNGKAFQIVLFHNVTPEEYIAEELRPFVARSFAQIQHFHHADRLWPFTQTNAEVLIQAGMDVSRIEIVNPAVPWPPRCLHIQKKLPVEILFVGRITKSKGVLDLLDAVQLVRSTCQIPFRLSLVGGQVERGYFETVKNRAIAMGPVVDFVGQCGNAELEARYHAAHILAIPSYHEGFCRPVAEGLRAGCIPVGYASYHLPLIANGLGRLSEPGNITTLAAALQSIIESVVEANGKPTTTYLPLDRGPTTVAEFDDLAGDQVGQFTFDRFSDTAINGIRTLISDSRSRTTAE